MMIQAIGDDGVRDKTSHYIAFKLWHKKGKIRVWRTWWYVICKKNVIKDVDGANGCFGAWNKKCNLFSSSKSNNIVVFDVVWRK